MEGTVHVLLVDDEPRVVEALERVLDSTSEDLEIETALGGEEALCKLEQDPFDLIITDMRMPVMDGAALLEQVHARWPASVRFVLSGQMDRMAAMRALPHAHQFLSKPCPVPTMTSAIARARSVRALVTDPVVRALVGEIDVLPTAGDIFQEVAVLLAAPEVAPGEVTGVFSRDPSLAARVLQLSNSSCFVSQSPTLDLKSAVFRLGIETLSALTLAETLARRALDQLPEGFDLPSFERRSVLCGSRCQSLAGAEGEAFVAGLLSQIGVLLVAMRRPALWREIERRVSGGERRVDVEIDLIGTTHARIGGQLLGLWGLPASIVNAVAFHDDPCAAPHRDQTLAALVHVATAIERGTCDRAARTDAQMQCAAVETWRARAEAIHLTSESACDCCAQRCS